MSPLLLQTQVGEVPPPESSQGDIPNVFKPEKGLLTSVHVQFVHLMSVPHVMASSKFFKRL